MTTFDNTPRLQTRCVSWSSIIAGCVAALAVHLLTTLLGIGLGIGASEPMTSEDVASDFSVGLGLTWSVSALLALWIGGWVAGRGAQTTNVKLGGLHGLLVWCTATVSMALLLSFGAGALIGGGARFAGQSLALAGKGAAAMANQDGRTANDSGGTMLEQFVRQNSDFIGSFLDELDSSGQNAREGTARSLSPTGRREIGWALYRFFNEDDAARTPAVRDAAIRAIAQQAGLNETDARRRLDDLAQSYDRAHEYLRAARERAEHKARAAAEQARRSVAHSAIWTVVAFVIGAFAAAWGGRRGASRAWEDMYPETPTSVPPLT